ncbi:hypothetical protein E2C01_044246 [Portunus trituberculatus]|uniref:Uncharacterized protein n=1 Tax=Portunus trituberculatus TaxID=210409 RepID=A0A5B7FZW8_PORTR|nr:hypothetical protein [Portunus trituberculatus]
MRTRHGTEGVKYYAIYDSSTATTTTTTTTIIITISIAITIIITITITITITTTTTSLYNSQQDNSLPRPFPVLSVWRPSLPAHSSKSHFIPPINYLSSLPLPAPTLPRLTTPMEHKYFAHGHTYRLDGNVTVMVMRSGTECSVRCVCECFLVPPAAREAVTHRRVTNGDHTLSPLSLTSPSLSLNLSTQHHHHHHHHHTCHLYCLMKHLLTCAGDDWDEEKLRNTKDEQVWWRRWRRHVVRVAAVVVVVVVAAVEEPGRGRSVVRVAACLSVSDSSCPTRCHTTPRHQCCPSPLPGKTRAVTPHQHLARDSPGRERVPSSAPVDVGHRPKVVARLARSNSSGPAAIYRLFFLSRRGLPAVQPPLPPGPVSVGQESRGVLTQQCRYFTGTPPTALWLTLLAVAVVVVVVVLGDLSVPCDLHVPRHTCGEAPCEDPPRD